MQRHYLEGNVLSPRGVRNALLSTMPRGATAGAAELDAGYLRLSKTAMQKHEIEWLSAVGVAYTSSFEDTARVRRLLEAIIAGLQRT